MIVTIQEAAVRLGVTPQTLRRWDRSGVLRPDRDPVSGHRVYSVSQIEELRSHRVGRATQEPASTGFVEVLPLDSFVGREDELAAIARRIDDGARILTLLGPPGVGKTRLALAVAGILSEGTASPRAVWFFDFTETSSVVDACGLIRRRLGEPPVDRESMGALTRAVSDGLRKKGRALFVLDNFEHLVETAAALVPTFARRAVDAVFLVTSRERLRVEGEQVLEVNPLTTPASDDVEAVRTSEAGRLFVARARSGSSLDEGNAALVAAIVRQLEGIPLAIELAAARTDTLSLPELLHRLEDRSGATDPAPRGVGPRRASLRGAIDCSWELLTPWERSALAQCSVFRGGFTMESAERVIDLSHLPSAPPVLDVVSALRDKSLLRRVSPRGSGGTPRLDMLLAVREYAAERLQRAGGAPAAFRRHARYFVEVGQRSHDACEPGDDVVALDAIEAEAENLTVIHTRVLSTGTDSEPAIEEAIRSLQILASVSRFRETKSRLIEAASRVVDLCEVHRVPSELVARALACRSDLHNDRGDFQRSCADASRGLSLGVVDRELESKLRAVLADALYRLGQSDRAAIEAQRSLALRRLLGHRRDVAVSLVVLARVLICLDRLEEAEAAGDEALALLEESNEQAWKPSACWLRGAVEFERGRLSEAKGWFGRAAELFGELKSPHAYATLLCAASIHHEEGALREARRLYLEALDAVGTGGLPSRKVGFQWGVSIARSRLGVLLANLGRSSEARGEFRAARRFARGFEPPLANLHVDAGHLDLADALAARMAGDATGMQRALGRAHHRLEEGRRAAARVIGWATSLIRSSCRILARAIEELSAPMPDDACVVAADGGWFWRPSNGRIELGRHPALARILLTLAEGRLLRPGSVLSHASLIDVGWPGASPGDKAGKHRLQMAISTLRRLGLKGLLDGTADGYRIPPAARLMLLG